MSARDFADYKIVGGAPTKSRIKPGSPDLKVALRLVEMLGLAPLARISNTQPKNYFGEAYQQWTRRRREVEEAVAAKLREHGATVDTTSDGARIRFAGFSGKEEAQAACAFLVKKKFACYAIAE